MSYPNNFQFQFSEFLERHLWLEGISGQWNVKSSGFRTDILLFNFPSGATRTAGQPLLALKGLETNKLKIGGGQVHRGDGVGRQIAPPGMVDKCIEATELKTNRSSRQMQSTHGKSTTRNSKMPSLQQICVSRTNLIGQ